LIPGLSISSSWACHFVSYDTRTTILRWSYSCPGYVKLSSISLGSNDEWIHLRRYSLDFNASTTIRQTILFW
jgi:hypothetical protein